MAEGWHGEWSSGLGGAPGGVGLMDLTVGQNRDGRLELFAIGSDGQLWHKWQTSPDNGWSRGWSSGLGRPRARLHTGLAVGRNASGRLEVFANDANGNVVHRWQTSPNDGWSRSWGYLHRPRTRDDTLQVLGVAEAAPGGLVVYADGGWRQLQTWYTWQVRPDNGWSQWLLLARTPARPVRRVLKRVMAANQDGRLEMFYFTNPAIDGVPRFGVYHQWQKQANQWMPPWWGETEYRLEHSRTWRASAIRFADGMIVSGGLPPTVIRNHPSGRLEVFATVNGRVRHRWQVAPNSTWVDGWAHLGTPPRVQLAKGCQAHLDADGRIVVFAVGDDWNLWFRRQRRPDDGWGPWENLGRPATRIPTDGLGISQINVAQNRDGRLEVFGVSPPDSTVWHIWET